MNPKVKISGVLSRQTSLAIGAAAASVTFLPPSSHSLSPRRKCKEPTP